MSRIVRGSIGEPIYRLNNQFWPDRDLMLKEAISLRDKPEVWNGELDYSTAPMMHGKRSSQAKASIKSLPSDEKNTPYLNQMFKGFTEMYGDFGNTHPNYFFIEPNWTYDWHVDTHLSKQMTGSSVLCAMNIVLTDDQTPAEFEGWGEQQYTACMFNTSVFHRVQTQGKLRVLARITFRDYVFEEVVYRIKKIDNMPTRKNILEPPKLVKYLEKKLSKRLNA